MDVKLARTALALCTRISQEPMPNAAARLAAWFVGAANATNGFPLLLTPSQIRYGFEKQGVKVAGMESRTSTIAESIEYLVNHGILNVEVYAGSEKVRSSARLYTIPE